MAHSPLRVGALLLCLIAAGNAASRNFGTKFEKLESGQSLSVRQKKPWEDKPVKNYRPLIGIMTQPCSECPGKSYVAADYVKWIEAAGGRAVPIRFYASDNELRRIFNSINGIVFPGGLTWLWLDAPYVITARKLFNWAVEANQQGDVFPIHGTCLGFQLLHILASNVSRNYLLVDTDSVVHPTTLTFAPNQAANSYMFHEMAGSLKASLESDKYNVVFQNHMYGLPPQKYETYPDLAEWYDIVSTSKDRNGTVYVSTIEGKQYPFFGTQWHPEKLLSAFGMEEVPHSIEAIRVGQHLSNTFMEAARRSSHTPQSKEEELALEIYDTCPIFSERFETMADDNYDGPDITYYFDKKENPPSGPDDAEHNNDDSSRLRLRNGRKPSRTVAQAAAMHPEGFLLG